MEQRIFKHYLVPKPNYCSSLPDWSTKCDWELEIGSGNGEFSVKRAIQFPDRQIIAIEKTRNKIKSTQVSLKNLRIYHTNAVWWVSHFVPENCLSRIFILYPNVYIKNKQSNLRWINRPFMSYLLSRLKMNGVIELRTNHFVYSQEFKTKMHLQFSYMNCIKDCTLANHFPETAFERKYLERKEICYLMAFQRVAGGSSFSSA